MSISTLSPQTETSDRDTDMKTTQTMSTNTTSSPPSASSNTVMQTTTSMHDADLQQRHRHADDDVDVDGHPQQRNNRLAANRHTDRRPRRQRHGHDRLLEGHEHRHLRRGWTQPRCVRAAPIHGGVGREELCCLWLLCAPLWPLFGCLFPRVLWLLLCSRILCAGVLCASSLQFFVPHAHCRGGRGDKALHHRPAAFVGVEWVVVLQLLVELESSFLSLPWASLIPSFLSFFPVGGDLELTLVVHSAYCFLRITQSFRGIASRHCARVSL
mmetsp:Transcript_5395/g.22305  ORF Transcript_5395/g.22305 Transcript_5395/m.22305 type:complete len:270 (+) Transcript_5395:436-1245(+)